MRIKFQLEAGTTREESSPPYKPNNGMSYNYAT